MVLKRSCFQVLIPLLAILWQLPSNITGHIQWYEAVFNESDVLDLVETTRENGQIIYTFELRETMQVKFKLQNKSQIPVKLSGIEILVDAS